MFIERKELRRIFEAFETTVVKYDKNERLPYIEYKNLKTLIGNQCPQCWNTPTLAFDSFDLVKEDGCYNIICEDCLEKFKISSPLFNRLIEDSLKCPSKIKEVSNKKEENNTMENKMFKGFDFGAIKNSSTIRLSHLGVAVKNAEGNFVSYDKVKEQLVDVDLFDINLEGMIFKMPVSHKDVKVADVILHNGSPVFVKKTGSNLEVIDLKAGEIKTIMPTKSLFGFDFFTKVVSLIDMSGMQANEDNPFGNLMPLMLMGNSNGDMKSMLPLLLMQGGGDFASNPLMLMAMCGDGNMSDMLPMMMMMGNNPFAPKKED